MATIQTQLIGYIYIRKHRRGAGNNKRGAGGKISNKAWGETALKEVWWEKIVKEVGVQARTKEICGKGRYSESEACQQQEKIAGRYSL